MTNLHSILWRDALQWHQFVIPEILRNTVFVYLHRNVHQQRVENYKIRFIVL